MLVIIMWQLDQMEESIDAKVYTVRLHATQDDFNPFKMTTDTADDTIYTEAKGSRLLARILGLSKDLRFDELRKVLESCGYEMSAFRSGSSHYTFWKRAVLQSPFQSMSQLKKFM